MSVQKRFVRKEFNFGLQERLTGTDMPVEENDFKTECLNSNGTNIKCVCLSYIICCYSIFNIKLRCL